MKNGLIIDKEGNKLWWLNDKRHREDGPAVEYASGTKEWYLNGQRHREDGPAIECYNGTKKWFVNGKKHNENGYSYINASGFLVLWHINGKCVYSRFSNYLHLYPNLSEKFKQSIIKYRLLGPKN
jgi:hypothetical protein